MISIIQDKTEQTMKNSELTRFQQYIKRYYLDYGRHDLPWRQTYTPYQVMVSELMLQQTQVERVIPKFLAFMTRFPTLESLAQADQSQVITAWQGLGYNRRGLNLQRAAQTIVQQLGGSIPKDETGLLALPGIGPYTASAIRAFAYNEPSVVIETNIRTVFIYHFFPDRTKVDDQELLPLIKETLDHDNPRQWYSALMDYGTLLKKLHPNPTRRSQSYAKQGPLKGSNREVRGAILKALTQQSPRTLTELVQTSQLEPYRFPPALESLVKDGFIAYDGEVAQLLD